MDSKTWGDLIYFFLNPWAYAAAIPVLLLVAGIGMGGYTRSTAQHRPSRGGSRSNSSVYYTKDPSRPVEAVPDLCLNDQEAMDAYLRGEITYGDWKETTLLNARATLINAVKKTEITRY